MADTQVPLTFRIFKRDGTLLREETVTRSPIKIGKLSSAHLRLDDESVNSMHAVIEVAGPQDLSIIDLGSHRGTLVNGQKVNKAKIQHGDRITLGDAYIELSVGAGAASGASQGGGARAAGGQAAGAAAPPPAPPGAAQAGAAPGPSGAGAPPGSAGAAGGGAVPPGAARPAGAAAPNQPAGTAAPRATGAVAAASPAAAQAAAGGGPPPGSPGQQAPSTSMPAQAGPPGGAPPGAPAPGAAGAGGAVASGAPAGGPPGAPAGGPPGAPAGGPPGAPAGGPPGAPAQSGGAPPPGMPGAPPPPGFGGAGPGGSGGGGDSIDELGGPRAVEVAAMFGGSVVGVKHVSNPRGGKVTPATYAMIAGGAALLLLAVGAFAYAVSNVAQNQDDLRQWLAEGRAYHDFRPERISLFWDWLAIMGLVGGAACTIGGLFRWFDERVVPYCKVGSAEDVDFAVSNTPAPSFPLVAPSGDDFVLNVGGDMDGEMTVNGQVHRISELQGAGRARPSQSIPGATEVPIPEGSKIQVSAGKTTFVVSPVPKPKRYPVPIFASMERSLWAFIGGTALALGLILLLLNTIPPDPRSLALDGTDARDRDSRVHSTAHEDPLQEEEEGDVAGGEGSVEMEMEEGEAGADEVETEEEARAEIEDRGAEEEQVTEAEAVEQARQAGIAGQLAADQGETFASLADTGDFTSGLDTQDIQGGLIGDATGASAGNFGGGLQGGGIGGGGDGPGTVGTGGRYGTIGAGDGTGQQYGRGDGQEGLQDREGRQPEVHVGDAMADGELPKEVIRRYIRRQLDRIRYCYERELQVHDGLAGTVDTQFQIGPQGGVLNARASGIGNRNVETCVAQAIQAIQFPAPRGGGLVNVNYPFTFQPSG